MILITVTSLLTGIELKRFTLTAKQLGEQLEIATAEEVNQLSRGDNGVILFSLKAALAEARRFGETPNLG